MRPRERPFAQGRHLLWRPVHDVDRHLGDVGEGAPDCGHRRRHVQERLLDLGREVARPDGPAVGGAGDLAGQVHGPAAGGDGNLRVHVRNREPLWVHHFDRHDPPLRRCELHGAFDSTMYSTAMYHRQVPKIASPAVRRALIERAAEMLARREPVTLRSVVAGTGVSTMAVYTHFDGMPGLWRAVRQEGFSRLAAELTKVRPSRDPVRDLVSYGGAYLSNALTHPDLYRAMFDAGFDLEDPQAAGDWFAVLDLERGPGQGGREVRRADRP